jgi:dolichol kinase
MTTGDLVGLGISYLYASSLLFVAEAVRRWRGYPQDFTRKIVHVGAGMWVFGVLALFDTWYIGVIPFISFIFLNYIFYRYRLLEAMDATDSTPGTVYFAFSISVLFVLFWRTNDPGDLSFVAAAGAMAMTWGDAMASIVGRRFGQHRYTVFGSTRSYEGSVAMLLASGTAMFLTIMLVPGSSLSPLTQPPSPATGLLAAGSGALVATLAEALSPSGTDNLSVPLLAGLTIFVMLVLVL